MTKLATPVLLSLVFVFAGRVVIVSQSKEQNDQKSGRLMDTVSDLQGAVVAHLTILLWNNKLRIKREINSDDSGNYGLNLPPGNYEVRVDPVAGSCKFRKSIRVAKGSTTQFNIRLKLCTTRSH